VPGRRPRTVAGAERETAILGALRLGCTRRAAAAVGDVSEDTLRRMMMDARFAEAVKKAEGEAEATYSGIVAQAAIKSWQAAAWWLERRKHSDYAQRSVVDMTVDYTKEAQRIAAEFGLDATEVMAEAERVLAEHR